MSSFLLDYPFAERLFPGAHELLKHMRTFGPTVILSDGDVVFLPRKVERAGLAAAVDDRVLLYVHKEEALDDVEPRYRAGHYAVVDDKLRILTAIKRYWRARHHRVRVSKELCPGSRRRQRVTGSGRGGEHIGDERDWEPHRLREAACSSASNLKVVPRNQPRYSARLAKANSVQHRGLESRAADVDRQRVRAAPRCLPPHALRRFECGSLKVSCHRTSPGAAVWSRKRWVLPCTGSRCAAGRPTSPLSNCSSTGRLPAP